MASRRELRDIISNYGITKMLGVKDRRTAEKFVADLEKVNVNGRRLYFINDIARKLDLERS